MGVTVKLKNVRLAFPQLWEAKTINDGPAKFGAAFIFPPDHPAVAAVKKASTEVAKEKWGEKAEAVFKALKASDRLALHDGDAKAEFAGYEGNVYLNSNNSLRPTVVDGARRPLAQADGKPYAGCYVNAIVEVWAQDHPKGGKRINASLQGVQFYADGERLAGGSVASEDDFDEIPGAGSDGFEDTAEEAGSASVFD